MTTRADSAVIEFPQARVRPAAPLAEGATAEVVIFTGVRIERLPSPAKRQPRNSAGSDIEFGR